jgi:hypothetical protein
LHAWNKFQFKDNVDDPVACALFFNKTVEAILKNVVGWDKLGRKYIPSILGSAVCHYGVVEEQQRKTLHLHMLVWIKEFDDYKAFHENMLQPEYHKNF